MQCNHRALIKKRGRLAKARESPTTGLEPDTPSPVMVAENLSPPELNTYCFTRLRLLRGSQKHR